MAQKIKEIEEMYPNGTWTEDIPLSDKPKEVAVITQLLKDKTDTEKAEILLTYIGGGNLEAVSQSIHTRMSLEIADYIARERKITLEEAFRIEAQIIYDNYKEWCEVPDWVHESYEE